jgi:predicted nucleotidyltransferase
MTERVAQLEGVPVQVAAVLSSFLVSANEALSADLVSAVLFGSAADGRLGPTSDVNLLLVLGAFSPGKMTALRDAFLAAEAAIKLRVMFLTVDELPSAAELFAQKFADIRRRHRTVFGKDVLASLTIPRRAEIFRLRQILLNLTLRLREAHVARGHRSEQVARILADVLGPLRAACATLVELEGAPATDSDAAFRSIAGSFGSEGSDAAARIMAAHDGNSPGPQAEQALFETIALAMKVSERAARLT